MEILCCTGVLIVLIVVLFAAPHTVSSWQRSRLGAKWRKLAESNGLTVTANDDQRSVKMSGPWDGRTVQVEVRTTVTGGIRGLEPRFPTWEHRTEISVELKPNSHEGELILSAHSLVVSIIDTVGSKLIDVSNIYNKTNDEAFNKRFHIMGTNIAFCEKALADPVILAGLITAKHSSKIKLEQDSNFITYSAPGMESNLETLTNLFNVFTNWADKIESFTSE